MDINQGQQKFNLMLSEIQPINRIHLMKTLRESCGKYKFYSWEIAENYSYITYLTNFRPIFDSEAQRKRVKVFHHLSKLIKTRTPEQIKSHHQKMLIKYKTIDQIIRCLRVKIFSELQLKEQLIPVIEQINKQAQQFCLSQKPLLKFAPYDYPEKSGKAMDKEKSELFEAHGVKIEEAPKCYITSLVKIEENPSAASLIACLKQEEEEDMVIRLNH